MMILDDIDKQFCRALISLVCFGATKGFRDDFGMVDGSHFLDREP
jgi:hypothetical protein